MKILLIEDDEYKAQWIKRAIESHFSEIDITEARSVNGGLAKATSSNPDLLILDMSLTTFDVGPTESGGRPQNFGGMEVLRRLEHLNCRIPTIVITQYNRFREGSDEMSIEKLRSNLALEFRDVVIDVIYYNSAQGRWKTELVKLLRAAMRKVARNA